MSEIERFLVSALVGYMCFFGLFLIGVLSTTY